MSRHYFSTQFKDCPVRVILGYDRPLDDFFLQVQHLDMKNVADDDLPFVYATVDDPRCGSVDIEYCRAKLQELNIVIPEAMFTAVLDDADNRVGNYVVEYFADGSTAVRLPKERSE